MRLRLFLAFTLVVVVSILSVLFLTWRGAQNEVRTFVARGGMMGIEALADELELYYRETGGWNSAQELLDNWRMGRGMGMGMRAGANLRLRLADADGRYVADNRGRASGEMTAAERSAAVVLYGPGGREIGYLVASGGTPVMSERNLLLRLLRAAWIAAGIAGGLALLLALLFSYQLNRPIRDLTRAASKLAAGDLSQRVPARGGPELSTLSAAFNRMAASLQRAEQNRRAMTADIAHELRTPIAIQRAHLEALQDGVYPLTVENLQPVLEQTELLTRLVEDLRTLALADAGELNLERSPVDIAELAWRVVDRFRPQAESSGVQIVLENSETETFTLNVDSGRVEQVLNNLLSNALRYTPQGGEVRVGLRRRDGWALLQVADTGPGIAAEDLPRLFERFFRADPSRSRAAGGTGLGLAIARQIALAHGGDLSAENRPEGGAVFTLRLPL